MLLEDCSNPLRGNKCIPSFARYLARAGGMKSGRRGRKGKEATRRESERTTGLESVPVGIARIERSQERARDPRQKTINTNFANSYTPPERRVALVEHSTVRTHPSPSDETDGDGERPPPLLARVRRLLRTRAPILSPRVSSCQPHLPLPFPISLNPRGFMTLDDAESTTIKIKKRVGLVCV